MPWFKVDDNLAFHAKTVAAGNAALGLWVRAGSWSAQTLTEGFVPDHMIVAFGGTKNVKALLENELWDRVDGGYQFHDWCEYQPSRESVENDRKAAKERQQRARDKARQARDAAQSPRDEDEPSQEDHGVSHGVTQALVTVPPTRPDPTLKKKTPSSSARKRAATEMPEGWKPNEKHLKLAQELGVSTAGLAANFSDHHAAKGNRFVDWDRAFFTWIRNAPQFAPAARPALKPVPAERDHFTPPPAPEDIPGRLVVQWNLAWSRANREGRPGPADWRELEAS